MQRPRWLPERLFPFRSHFLEIEGCRVHYVDEGSGPVLLMLHGNPTWSFVYRNIIAGLLDRFRCVAVDYPGFGLSTAAPGYDFRPASHARIVERLVLALELTGITPVVHDWGGPIGFAVAGRHPERVRAFVIGNTWAWPVAGDKRMERFSKLMGGPLGGFLIRNFNTFVNVLLPVGVRRRTLPREVLDAYRGPFATHASREAMHVMSREIVASELLTEAQAAVRQLAHLPALIVWGERDVAFREGERRRFEALFADHRTKILRGAGHYIQEDAPEEIVAAVRAWWSERLGIS